MSSVDLGSIVAKEAIQRAGTTKLRDSYLNPINSLGLSPNQIEETVAGSVLTAGQGQNVGRQIATKIG